MEKMCCFVSFVTHIYIPQWFQCPLSASAPKNDLIPARNIALFAEKDQCIADAVFKGFKNHFWYLIEEMIPLSLFDQSLSVDEKSQVAVAILKSDKSPEFVKRHGSGFG